jgi:hypothetical protein
VVWLALEETAVVRAGEDRTSDVDSTALVAAAATVDGRTVVVATREELETGRVVPTVVAAVVEDTCVVAKREVLGIN